MFPKKNLSIQAKLARKTIECPVLAIENNTKTLYDNQNNSNTCIIIIVTIFISLLLLSLLIYIFAHAYKALQ